MKLRRSAKFALALVASSALAVSILTPAQAATRSTVVLISSADITSLNSGTQSGNTSYNNVPASLTGMGFLYYDADATLVMNTKFGTMKVVKKKANDFQIKYTVASGQQWSDGTPIDAVDLLVSHIIQADKYSKEAGLGDPTDNKVTPAFDSVSYSSTYADHVVGLPVVSSDRMSLTVKFDKPLPDWELLAPGPTPVHALTLMADGKKGLQSASANITAKNKFKNWFLTKNPKLVAVGKIWSTGYDLTKIDASTNDLLLVSNGGFIVSKFTFGDSMTLVRNPKYSSGPAMQTVNPVNTIVIKIIKDNTAMVQALRNGDVDVYYNTLPTANDKLVLEALPNATTITKVGGNYSHLDLRVGAFTGEAEYKGIFAGNSQRSKDLRKAFLLATPRQQMVDTLIKPVKPDAATLDTQFAFQGTSEYKTITASSGVSEYTTGTQADRTAKALALVKKYYPTASADNPLAPVNFVHANTTLRNNLAKLIIVEATKAGFKVTDTASANLFGPVDNNMQSKFDVTMYGFGLNSISQANSTGIYKSDGGNNVWGWNDPEVDKLMKSLEGDILTPAEITAKRLAADKLIMANAWGLPLYANPTIASYSKDLKGIDPAPIGANITWNFFDWSFK
jgi:peptide/nickel transport system substrate-binding protein